MTTAVSRRGSNNRTVYVVLTVGLILMIVGAIGLAIGIWKTTRYTGRSAPVARDDRYVRDDRY